MNECNWDPHGCQSLLGYGMAAHEKSGGVCAYCGLGKDGLDVHVWKQMSIDHVLAANTAGVGGVPQLIVNAFPNFLEIKKLSYMIDEINLVTACNFCNSMTSRKKTIRLDSIFPERQERVCEIGDEIIQKLLNDLQNAVDEEYEDKVEYIKARMIILDDCFRKEVVPKLSYRRVILGYDK